MEYHEALMRRLGMIQDLGSNATRLAMEKQALRPQQNYLQGMPTGLKSVGNTNTSAPNTPSGSFGAFINAIAGQESGGNYSVQNKDSGAMGKYQIMPSNIMGVGRGWDYEALGRDINIGEFLGSPQIQEAIAQYKLKSYYDKYGPAGAAVAWYAGPGTVSGYLKNPGAYTNPQGAYPSIGRYVQDILRRMG